MKTIYIKITNAALLVFAILITACNSLDLNPIDSYGNKNYWKTAPHVQAYLTVIPND